MEPSSTSTHDLDPSSSPSSASSSGTNSSRQSSLFLDQQRRITKQRNGNGKGKEVTTALLHPGESDSSRDAGLEGLNEDRGGAPDGNSSSGEDDQDGDLNNERGMEQEEDDEEEEAGNVSAFTDPSWYGSPFHRRDSSIAWAASSPNDMDFDGKSKQTASRATLTNYQKGVQLARRALLDMDEEMDRFQRENGSGSHGALGLSAFASSSPAEDRNRAASPTFSMASSTAGKRFGKLRASTSGFIMSRSTSAQKSNATVAVSSGTNILTSFDNCPTYLCASCGTTLALQDELISKAFSGRDGKAYLFFSILNINTGPKEDRQLLTGLHTVADLSCATCQRSVGWSYVRAFEASQRYKEGKFILERASLHKTNNWAPPSSFDTTLVDGERDWIMQSDF